MMSNMSKKRAVTIFGWKFMKPNLMKIPFQTIRDKIPNGKPSITKTS